VRACGKKAEYRSPHERIVINIIDSDSFASHLHKRGLMINVAIYNFARLRSVNDTLKFFRAIFPI